MTPATKTGQRLVAQGFDVLPGEVVDIETETMAMAAGYVRMVRDELANRGQPQNPEWSKRLLELMEWKRSERKKRDHDVAVVNATNRNAVTR